MDDDKSVSVPSSLPVWRALAVSGLVFAGMALAKGITVGSSAVARWIYPLVSAADPAGAYLYLSIHHVVQMLVALALILVAVRAFADLDWATFGFTLRKWRFSLSVVAVFCVAWFLIQAGVGYWLVATGTPATLGFELTPANLAGYLAFQLFLSGTSEEILFRGLIMTGLILVLRPLLESRRTLGLLAIAASTIIFMFEHIGFALHPLRITHFDVLQQGTVLVFGLFYGMLYWRSKSLLGPIVAHGVLNTLITGIGVWLYAFAG